MGGSEFYLNALPEYRRDAFEFFLSINQYVQDNAGHGVLLTPALPRRIHPKFSKDVGDVVLYFVNSIMGREDVMEEVNGLVNNLQHEQSTDIPGIRDQVLRMANENLLALSVRPGMTLNFRDYLLNFVKQQSVGKNLRKGFQDKLKIAISSPAVLKVRKFVDLYSQPLNDKQPKSYLKFLACVCALLLKIASLQVTDGNFQVLGEIENVLYRYKDSFPGYVNLDNYAKFEKLLVCKIQTMNTEMTDFSGLASGSYLGGEV